MKSKEKDNYMLVVVNDITDIANIKDCLIVSCTNKTTLSKLSGIPIHRLTYVFTRLGLNVLIEKGNLIIRSSTYYLGRQPGGLRNKNLSGYNR